MEHETTLRYALAVAITTNKNEQSAEEPRWLAIIAMLAQWIAICGTAQQSVCRS